jgi:hypothetical protein
MGIIKESVIDLSELTLTYSIADQNFKKTKSIGIFNVSTQLLENLCRRVNFKQLSVLSNSILDDKLHLPADVKVYHYDGVIKNRLSRVLWDQWGSYRAAKNVGNQWLFIPKGFASFMMLPEFKLAAYVYDAAHNFYRMRYPNAMPWLENEYFIRCLKETLKHADVIFTDSDFTKNELNNLARNFKIKPGLIINAGIGFVYDEKSAMAKKESLLLLTSSWPHKLTKLAIGFLKRWQRETNFLGTIELIGNLPSGVRLPDLASWRHYRYLPETDYRKVLASARALLFFSTYEGFGMPPVEATIAGTCPVFSDLPVTREVMGSAGFSFSNDSYESFALSLNEALKVPPAKIKMWADILLQHHNWDRVIEKIISGLKYANK